MSVLLEIPNCDRNLNRERSKSTECLDDSMYCLSEVSMRAQSTQDLSRPGSQHNHSHHLHAPQKHSSSIRKPRSNADEPVFFRSGTTKRKAAVPFSVKYAVSPTKKVGDLNALEGKSPGGKSKVTTDLLDLTLLQIKANLSSLHSERVEMEAKLAWILDDIKETQMMSNARSYSRSASLPEDRLVTRSKSMSRSPHKPQVTLCTWEEHTSPHSEQVDSGVPLNRISPEGSLAEGRSFLNRGKSMREVRDGSLERRNFFSPSFYRSMRTKKDTLDPSSASSSKSNSLQRGVQRTSSMRQKLSSIVKSPTRKLLKNSSPSLSGKNSSVSSKSDISLSPRIICPSMELKSPSRNSAHRNSLPESILITTIPEDGVEFISETHTHFAIHHDHFDAPEEKSVASTSAIVRRSSLTGQLEHCYKSAAKPSGDGEKLQRRDSEGGYSTSSETRSISRSNSTRGSIISLSKSPDRRSLKGAVILSGTETTV